MILNALIIRLSPKRSKFMKSFFLISLFFLSLIGYSQFKESKLLLYTGIKTYRSVNINGTTNRIAPTIGLYKMGKKGNINDFQFHNFTSTKSEENLLTSDNQSGLYTKGEISASCLLYTSPSPRD